MSECQKSIEVDPLGGRSASSSMNYAESNHHNHHHNANNLLLSSEFEHDQSALAYADDPVLAIVLGTQIDDNPEENELLSQVKANVDQTTTTTTNNDTLLSGTNVNAENNKCKASPISSSTTSSSSKSTTTSTSAVALIKSTALPSLTSDRINGDRYLLGSVTFFNSFFGSDELQRYFPEGKLRLSINTWNMSSKEPDDYNAVLHKLLIPRKDVNKQTDQTSKVQMILPEVYVIGLQEAPKSEVIVNNVKICIQATLGPHYALLQWSSLGVLHASIWIRRELLWSCTLVDTIPIHSRPTAANRMRTKGAIALSFSLFGTSFLFINTHLSAHANNIKTRINQLEKLQHALNITSEIFNEEKHSMNNNNDDRTHWTPPKHGSPVQENHTGGGGGGITKNRNKNKTNHNKLKSIEQFEYIFWFGDLNFRLELDHQTVLKSIHSIATAKNEEERLSQQHELMRWDQLTNLMARGIVFDGFQEALWPPPFLPTYKFKPFSSSLALSNNELQTSRQTMVDSTSESNSLTQSSLSSTSSMINNSFKSSNKQMNDTNNTENNNESYELAPLFKLEEIIDDFDYDPSRVPSFTDRILYHACARQSQCNQTTTTLDQGIKCLKYDSIGNINSSDHKPVQAIFEVTLDPGGLPVLMHGKKVHNSAKKSFNPNKEPHRKLSLETENNDNKAPTTTSPTTKNVKFFGRRLGRKARPAKVKENWNGRVNNLQHNVPLSSSTGSLSSINMMGRFDKLARLNAGAFERQVFLEGLRLRNILLQSQLVEEYRQRRQFGLFKSRSLDSKVPLADLSNSNNSSSSTIQLSPQNKPNKHPASAPRSSDVHSRRKNSLSDAETGSVVGLSLDTKSSSICRLM